jgi:hypothetical protein
LFIEGKFAALQKHPETLSTLCLLYLALSFIHSTTVKKQPKPAIGVSVDETALSIE